MQGQLGPAPRMHGSGSGNRMGVQPPAANLDFFSGAPSGPPPTGMAPVAPPQQFSGGFNQPPAGSMGTIGGPPQPSNFPSPPQNQHGYDDDDIDNEPPLLEELGINVEHIWLRIQGVAFFKKVDSEILADSDLMGPAGIASALALCMVFSGKLQIAYVWGLWILSTTGVFVLINLLSQKVGIGLYDTISILGYGLLPIVLLAFVGIFVSLKGTFGLVIAMLCIGWATTASSRFFATAISMQHQRWLVAYPILLSYTYFTVITIF